MNENKMPAIWKWTVLLLILCNIGLMLTIWLKPHWGGDGNGNEHPERPREYVIRELKFTEEQVGRYDELIHEHRSAMDSLREQSMGLRKQLFSNLKNQSGALNTDSLVQLIGNNQKMIEQVTYDHFKLVRTICTDAQKSEFDKIITDVIRKMNGGMRGGPPPHERDGQGPPEHRPGERDNEREGRPEPPPERS